MIKRTYIDSNVLIAAFRSDTDTAMRALAVLDDPYRRFVTSAFVRLETWPKPAFHGFQDEAEFIGSFLDRCAESVEITETLVARAVELAARYDLSLVDALHASAAILAGVDEFVTLEKPGKPLCRMTEIMVLSIYRSQSVGIQG
jgi:predicted nucleic acid-binding protein